jgi:phosphoglycolate phosphatase
MGRPYRTIIFDLDGTLVDSKPGIHGSIRHALGCLGHELAGGDDLDWVLGPPLEVVMTRLLASRGDDRTALAVAHYREHYGAGGLFDARPYEGIPELLDELSSSGRTLFVGTSKYTPFARRVLERFGLSGFFAGVYGTEPNARVTPKADLIRQILSDRQLDAVATVMVGDREHDIIGARSNGVAAIGAVYGYGTREELLSAGAEAFCDRPVGLLDLV